MKDTRWEKMVAKVQIVSARDGMGPVVLRSTAVTLLARQHAAMVRMVKTREAGVDNYAFRDGYEMAKCDILAALAKQGKK